jgi:hypothetical protein
MTNQAPPFPRIRQLAEQLHALGPKPLTELLLEVAAGSNLWDRLGVYCRLDPEVVRKLGGDNFNAEATANETALRIFPKHTNES